MWKNPRLQPVGNERMPHNLKIFVTGTRGVPDIPGGVEKHCQELYPLIVKLGYDIVIATRKPYVSKEYNQWNKIKLIHLYSPAQKSFEAIVHTFLAVLKAKKSKADIIHIHSVGPGLMVPFAKIMGLKVVVTNHGPDYDRQKWGILAKTILRLGEYLGGKFADGIIVISGVIQTIVSKRCKKKSYLIYNGVPLPRPSKQINYLNQINAKPRKYILAVSRFVPEKGLDLLVSAFQNIDTDLKLIIVGDADHETDYSRHLKQMIDQNKNICRTGYIVGEPLHQLFSHAKLFVLPSYHEGLPIALLEAMSYGLSVLVSDIPANMEINLSKDRFFRCGKVDDLEIKLKQLLETDISEKEQSAFKLQLSQNYCWSKIARQTVKVYEKILCANQT
jgi:glycosyltransferase involved in cell wall biosynthesis